MIRKLIRFPLRFKYRLIPETVVLLIVVPVTWLLMDRTPPFTRLHGQLLPQVVVRGETVRVQYVATRRISRNCPGTVSQEIVDSHGTTFGKRDRSVGPASWADHPTNPMWEIFTGWPVSIPEEAAPGRASFRTVTFRYCNRLQEWLHWPIVQIGPDLDFTILCNEGYDEVRGVDGRLRCVARTSARVNPL